MKMIRSIVLVLARFLLSFVFLAGAFSKILRWHETEKFLMNTLCDWQMNVGFSDDLQYCLAQMISLTPLLLAVATLFELLGGLSILLGIKEKFGAFLLLLVMIPVTLLMHPFWFAEGAAREIQTVHFLKNLAIIGALLLVALQGTQGSKNSFPMKFG